MAGKRLDAETKELFKQMKAIVDKEVQHYQSDLDIDKRVIEKSRLNERFVWSVYDCGTRIMPLDKMRPIEYEIGKTEGWVPNKQFFLIQKGHSEMKEITREESIDLIKNSNRTCYDRLLPGDTVVLENGQRDAVYDICFIKQPNESVLQVEKNKIFNTYKPLWFIEKGSAIEHIQNTQLENKYLDASVQNPFTRDELQKLANFQTIMKKPSLKRKPKTASMDNER